MKKYIKRGIEKLVIDYLESFPVVAITGPRQSGKSTLLKHLLKGKYRYVSFDHFKTHQLFYDDPEKFMEIYSDRVIFDEVQKAPEIFNFIKVAVDEDRENYGKFILTGSSQFSFIQSISESLAGRIGLLTLLPFGREEIPIALHESSLYSGGFPELIDRK